MSEQSRAFGYICPHCGKAVYGERPLFAIAAAPMEIPCECGKSVLRTEYDGLYYQLEVPCGLCGGTHSAKCKEEAILKGRGIGLSCAKTKQICCYIGDVDQVAAQMHNLEVLAEKLKDKNEENGAFLDEVIMYEVLSELKEIAARGGISCDCGSKNWGMKIRNASVEVFCKDCGARMMIPAATDGDLDDLCCQLTLKIKNV